FGPRLCGSPAPSVWQAMQANASTSPRRRFAAANSGSARYSAAVLIGPTSKSAAVGPAGRAALAAGALEGAAGAAGGGSPPQATAATHAATTAAAFSGAHAAYAARKRSVARPTRTRDGVGRSAVSGGLTIATPNARAARRRATC